MKKMNSTVLFSCFRKPENFRKLLTKEAMDKSLKVGEDEWREREKGNTKESRRLVLRSFGKGRRETQKEFRRLVLGKFFLTKGEENEKI